MPTNEERREVARKLRDTGNKLGQGALLWFHVAKVLGVRTSIGGKAACDMLADLIEPEPERTCRDVSGCDEFFHCSECDGALSAEYGDSRLFKNDYLCDGFDYCPFCGAKVTKEDTCR